MYIFVNLGRFDYQKKNYTRKMSCFESTHNTLPFNLPPPNPTKSPMVTMKHHLFKSPKSTGTNTREGERSVI